MSIFWYDENYDNCEKIKCSSLINANKITETSSNYNHFIELQNKQFFVSTICIILQNVNAHV